CRTASWSCITARRSPRGRPTPSRRIPRSSRRTLARPPRESSVRGALPPSRTSPRGEEARAKAAPGVEHRDREGNRQRRMQKPADGAPAASLLRGSGAARLARLQARIVACRRCPRLVAHREAVAARPPRRYAGARYWARPVPSLGAVSARLLLVGLAPAAHGGNRTGRMFTGDAPGGSGEWVARALHAHGFAT